MAPVERWTREALLGERMRRQALDAPLRRSADYATLFRRLQPVTTKALARPGSPPRLEHRTRFDDAALADKLRAERRIVKGRFGAGVAYVWREDLALFANAHRRPLARPSAVQRRVLDAVVSAGPLTPRQLKDETGLLNKQLMPALHRLQQAFLVYEDQLDEDWDRSWYEFSSEWPELELAEPERAPCVAEVVARFVEAMVFASFEQIRDGTRLPARELRAALTEQARAGRLLARAVAGVGEGYRAADEAAPRRGARAAVYLIHKSDFLARACASELGRRFGREQLLHYLWIDGEPAGVVRGRWGFKPYDVSDITLELPRAGRAARKREILAAVAAEYPPPRHGILRYDGRRV